jgi:hypothetical protein
MITNFFKFPRTLTALTSTMALMAGIAMAQTETASTKSPDPKVDKASTTESKSDNPRKSAKAAKTTKKPTDTVPTSQTVGEDAGNYTVVGSIEFGYRGQSVSGDVNKYKSDLNYKAGPRFFDSTFLMRAKDGKAAPWDTLLVTSTGWGADPYSNMRISVENSKYYRFDGNYRRFKYYNFLNNLANPFTSTNPTTGSPVVVLPNPVTGKHGYDVRQQLGDFDLTILPKNERLNFTFGFSPEGYKGTTYTTYHAGGGEFFLPVNADSHANDFRAGVNWKLGPVYFNFLQGYRRFRDDSNINAAGAAANYLATSSTNLPVLNTFTRLQPTKGTTDYTRFNVHTLLARKIDLTGRLIYSDSNTNFTSSEYLTGQNWTIVRGSTLYTLPNVITQSALNFTGAAKRPSTIGDGAITFLATSKLTLSDTFRFEQYQIGSGDFYTSQFYAVKPPANTPFPPAIVNGNYGDYGLFKYRKYLNTVEGDYQISKNYAFHFGYRYGHRREEDNSGGYTLGGATTPAAPTAIATTVEENHTNSFFGGLRARPTKTWTLYFDAEHGTADNIFTRWGTYDYTNFRVKSRYIPNRKLALNFAVITRDNADPSTIEGVSLADFGVSVKSRVFTSDVQLSPSSRITFNGGYNYNWYTSDSIINYAYAMPPFNTSTTTTTGQASVRGHSLYYVRNNYFYLESTARLNNRMTLYAGYRMNLDHGQGNNLSTPVVQLANPIVVTGSTTITGTGNLITSYPMSFQSPEARLAIKLNTRLDWNLGYQYFNYNESDLVKTFAGTVRPQNYHAHLPYMSLRLYFGRKE